MRGTLPSVPSGCVQKHPIWHACVYPPDPNQPPGQEPPCTGWPSRTAVADCQGPSPAGARGSGVALYRNTDGSATRRLCRSRCRCSCHGCCFSGRSGTVVCRKGSAHPASEAAGFQLLQLVQELEELCLIPFIQGTFYGQKFAQQSDLRSCFCRLNSGTYCMIWVTELPYSRKQVLTTQFPSLPLNGLILRVLTPMIDLARRASRSMPYIQLLTSSFSIRNRYSTGFFTSTSFSSSNQFV